MVDYRSLGQTGMKVSEIGFGTWQLGGISWIAPDDAECIALLRSAFEAGINLYDVSPSYGNGRSEALIAHALGDERKNILISGKVGVLEDGTYHGFWSERQLRESLEQSLKRLKTDHLDLLTLHAPPMDVMKSGYAMDFLHKLKDKGMIRFFGVSLEAQPEEALIALEQGIDVLQIRFNLLFPEARKVFNTVAEKQVGLIINSPFGHGYLSGRYQSYDDIAEGDYPKGSFRSTKPRELVEGMIQNANSFSDLTSGNVHELPNIALGFILSHNVVSSVVPGIRSGQELHNCLAVSSGKVHSGIDKARVQEIYQEKILHKH